MSVAIFHGLTMEVNIKVVNSLGVNKFLRLLRKPMTKAAVASNAGEKKARSAEERA